jgi:O-antigen ligase
LSGDTIVARPAAIEDIVQTFRSIQLWATITALSLAPLFFGSVDRSWIAIWTVVLSISVLCGAVARRMGASQRRVVYTFLAVCSVYAIVAAIQIAPDFMTNLNDPIWQRTSKLLDTNLPMRISSRAEIPPVAIGHFVLVVTAFLSGFLVGTSRRDSDILSGVARYSILFYAIYGLFALAFTPNLLLWAPKTAYVGSFTASFVNHNTAAAFVGVGAILWLCLAFSTLQSLTFSSVRLLLLTRANEQVAFKLILRSAAGLCCFFALLLSNSRGGLICSCLGLLIAVGLIVVGRNKSGFWCIFGLVGVVAAATFGWLTHMGRIGSEGLFDSGRWSVYGYCIEIIRERPLLGTGLGTFGDFFPSVRGTDLSSLGVWDYAHSTILEIAVEMGIPVAAMIAIAAIASTYILLRATLRSKDRSRSSFAAMTGISILAYLHSIIDFSLQIPGFFIVFWILTGNWLARSLEEESATRRTGAPRFTELKSTGEVDRPVGVVAL